MKRIASIAFFLFTTFCAITAQSALQPLVIVKLSGHETVTVKELKSRVEIYQRTSTTPFDVSQRKQILDSLVDEKLVVQAAQKAGISIPDSRVDEYFLASMSQQVGKQVTEKELSDLVRQQMNMSLDDLLLKQVGFNLAEYKAYLKKQLIAQQYILSQKQEELKTVAATDKEIRDFYELNKASFVQNDMLRMFLVIVPKGDDSVAAKAKTQKLLDDYSSKKLTADQMRVQSKNPTEAGYQAGDLLVSKTEQHANQLGIPYERLLQIFEEKVNVTSDIKETSSNYQFYVIMEKYNAKMLSIADVVQPGTTVTVYDYIKQNLTQNKQGQFLQQAIQDITKKLNTSENVEWKKTGADLDKLLAW